MPELRKDPISERWVIVATERARRPGNIISAEDDAFIEDPCPFCEGKESQTPHEIYAIRKPGTQPNKPGWLTRVIPSDNPLFGIQGDLSRRGHGLYDVMQGVGAHEVVLETPQHTYNMADLDASQIACVIKTYAQRSLDLRKDPRFQYLVIFKRHGLSAGSHRIKHARSHIVATPVNPKMIKEKLKGAKRYYDYHERCIYCDLIRQEREAGERIVCENDAFIALTPFASRFSFEVWILPKRHSCDFALGVAGSENDAAALIKQVLMKFKNGLGERAYNYVIHSAPFRGKKAKAGDWQTLDDDYHWHIELIPRLTHIAGFEKGTGFYICPVPPETTAEFLRKADG